MSKEMEEIKKYFGATDSQMYELIMRFGKPIKEYPCWHPLSIVDPNNIKGIDHVRFFAGAVVTCPYGGGKGIIKWINKNNRNLRYEVREDLDFYAESATTIIIYPDTVDTEIFALMQSDEAVPMFLQHILDESCVWQCRETWDMVNDFYLGSPVKNFVDAETAKIIKKMFKLFMKASLLRPCKTKSMRKNK